MLLCLPYDSPLRSVVAWTLVVARGEAARAGMRFDLTKIFFLGQRVNRDYVAIYIGHPLYT